MFLAKSGSNCSSSVVIANKFYPLLDPKHECGNHNIRIELNVLYILETVSAAFGIDSIVWMYVNLWDFMRCGMHFYCNYVERDERTMLG